MRKFAPALVAVVLLSGSVACKSLNSLTPGPLDNTAIETEVRKNLAGDRITGLTIDVHDGVVTLNGHVKNAADRSAAESDAQKVNGVKSVVDNLTIDPM